MILSFLITTVFLVLIPPQNGFLTEQKKFSKVRTAISEKEKVIEQKLATQGLKLNNYYVLVAAYKDSDELEIYTRKKTETVFKKLVSYPICARSGELGPKRKRGDMQVPEGFYHVNMFNPTSNFYLSLGINYPNTSDKRKTTAADPGGEIFIHGACVTIGCLPMTDENIKEIYLYAAHARNNGQMKIPVYIFPFKMTDQNFSQYNEKYKDDTSKINFWSNLKTGYDKFAKDHKELKVTFGASGDYIFAAGQQSL
jgi:murein L,D-transpeptidase YafK